MIELYRRFSVPTMIDKFRFNAVLDGEQSQVNLKPYKKEVLN